MNTVFEFRRCGIEHLDTVLDVESETLQSLERPDALRRNSLEMWRRVLQPPHYCLGAWVGEELAGFAVLYIPSGEDPDNLAAMLKNVDVRDYVPANYKICIVRPRWRGRHLQFQLGQRLAAEAKTRGINLLCATASPYNMASVRSLLDLGYREDSRVEKYGFERILFYQIN